MLSVGNSSGLEGFLRSWLGFHKRTFPQYCDRIGPSLLTRPPANYNHSYTWVRPLKIMENKRGILLPHQTRDFSKIGNIMRMLWLRLVMDWTFGSKLVHLIDVKKKKKKEYFV